MSVVYDAALLVAADRGDRAVWADHQARLELGVLPMTTGPVVAQVSRSPRQVQLRRLLRGCHIEPFTAEQAHTVGELLARTRTCDVIDAHLIHCTAQGATVHTGDPDDLRRLAGHAGKRIRIRRI
ncbi:MAG TPA: hypothetical protein VHV82_11710 [Sporichthyaceae bacterium]|nr:hypothetical protein [Sporichthyaceae bacterium]